MAPSWTPNTLGEHLRHRRLTLRLTQQEAAEAIGLYPTNFSDWERGAVLEPQAKLWPGIIRFLGYDPVCPTPKTLPDEIRYLCRHLGVSREALSKLFGVTGHTVLEWEAGRIALRQLHRERLTSLLSQLGML